MKPKQFFNTLKKAASGWSCDKAPTLAASLAFYALLSLAPLLVLMVKILSFFVADARGEIIAQADAFVGPAGRDAVIQSLDSMQEENSGLVATVSSLFLLAFGATGVLVQLQDALNTIWEVKRKAESSIKGFIRKRLVSLAMVIGISVMLLLSLIASTVLQAMSDNMTGIAQIIAYITHPLVSTAILTFLFAATFKFIPDAKIPWRDVWFGGFFTAVLFTVGKVLLGLYFAHSSTTSAYGAAGSLAALLIWIYYSAQIFFFGAELTQAYACAKGDPLIPEEHAEPLTEEARTERGLKSKKDRNNEHSLHEGMQPSH